MRRSEAARYARWSAAIALLLASVTAIVYLRRGWTSHVERKNAPPPAPVDVSRQSAGITFKKFDEQNRIIFTVDASKSTDFKDQDASLLEDVKITIFGQTGDRNDVIHTKSCQYGKENGSITCSGDVQLDLMSAADAKRVAGNPDLAKAVSTRVETRGVTFDRATGIARTDARVIFAFPSGSGDATGMQYNSDEGTVRLLREVRLKLVPIASEKAVNASRGEREPQNARARQTQEVHITGSSLEFARETRLMRLQGPVEAETPTERMTAGQVSLALDGDFHARTFLAVAAPGGTRPQLTSRGSADQMTLEADTLTASLTPEGSVTQLVASGAVHGFRSGESEEDEASGDSGTLDLWPRVSQPKELNLSGNVALRSSMKKTGETRSLQTSAFRMEFSEAKQQQGVQPVKAETLAAGTMEWTDAASRGAPGAHTKIHADKLAMDFAEQGKARRLQALGNVQTERRVAGHPLQTATAQNGVAEMSRTGGWSQMDLQGNAKLKEGDRTGQADHATFVRASQTAVLTGQAVARDANTETYASRITFEQATGDIVAEGKVRSTDFSSNSSAVRLAPAPANITSDSLQANSKTGRALYSGHARLWQGDSVLEANSIELLRDTRVLNAVGNVRSVFPQVAAQPTNHPSESALDSKAMPVKTTEQNAPRKSQLWHATSGTLTYQDEDGHAHLQRNVVVQSADQVMRGPELDLYFTRAGGTSDTDRASTSGGAQQISRAVGTGGVTVEQAGRKAVADRGEYTASSGRFVMSGGTPTIYDGSAGSTTGRQLTFFLADDTIIVDSENGSRTLTKHRVEK
jgi:LPS export ABC transporter protein LptC